MSYDLNFWKYKERAVHDNQKIYDIILQSLIQSRVKCVPG